MTLPTRGSVDWFKYQKAQILRHARALDSISSALRLVSRLCKDFDTIDAEINSALLSTVCINYSRPFVQTPSYPVRHLKAQKQFDPNIHQHLVELRHKLIAHSDEAYADAKVHLLSICLNLTKNGVDTPRTIPQSIHVRVTALESIHSRELLERIHPLAAALWIKRGCESCDYSQE